jgi:magnesium-protoporphyrin O-methyltransferase
MACCQCSAIEEEFDARVVQQDLARYRRRGPAHTTRWLIEALQAEGVAGRTLLDIGGGVGAIQHALLRAGASRAVAVEAARAYLDADREEAARQGHAERLDPLHGDFVALAETLPTADLVTLDRVICCYPDMPALVGRSVERARVAYGLVYPRDTWWMRLGLALVNLTFQLRHRSFRTFVHPTAAVDAIVRDHGFVPRFRRTTPIWQVVVYARP